MKHPLIVALLALVVVGAAEVRGSEVSPRRARLRILVPEDAFVFVDRERMRATGEVRLFESPPLKQGLRYSYEISVIHEGQEVVRTVRFQAGRTVEVDFRQEIEKLSEPTSPGRTLKPIRPEWLPRRVWRA
jgi:uncharacterized protein (TIGR03000 family)